MIRTIAERLLARLLPVLYLVRLMGWRIFRPFMIGVRVLVFDGDRLLLVRGHGRQEWHLPGGAIKRSEELAVAAKREVFEETGCRVEIDRLLGMYTNFSEYKSDHVAIFVGHPISGLAHQLNIEIAEARYFPVTDLPRPLHSSVIARLADYDAGNWGMHGPWSSGGQR